MPNFTSEAHRRKWIASQRRNREQKKRTNGSDMLAKGAELGRRHPPIAPRASDKPSASLDPVLNVLRTQRVRAEEKVTQIDRAIQALEALK